MMASYDKKAYTVSQLCFILNFDFLRFRFMLFKQVDMSTAAVKCSERRKMRYVLPPQVMTPIPTGKISSM